MKEMIRKAFEAVEGKWLNLDTHLDMENSHYDCVVTHGKFSSFKRGWKAAMAYRDKQDERTGR
jgi:hypothetical protein